MADLYRAAPFKRYALGDGAELCYLPMKQAALVAQGPDLRLLAACSSFRTLDEHAAGLRKILAGGVATDVLVRALEQLVAAGCLVSQTELLNPVDAPDGEENTTSMRSVVTPTCSRGAELRRSVRSYMQNAVRHGRRCRVVVTDDSIDQGQRAASRAMLQEESDALGLDAVYLGAEEKAVYQKALIDKGLPPEVVAFALGRSRLCDITTGANRNLGLVFTAGEAIVSVDDDTVCATGCAFGGHLPAALSLDCHANHGESR